MVRISTICEVVPIDKNTVVPEAIANKIVTNVDVLSALVIGFVAIVRASFVV